MFTSLYLQFNMYTWQSSGDKDHNSITYYYTKYQVIKNIELQTPIINTIDRHFTSRIFVIPWRNKSYQQKLVLNYELHPLKTLQEQDTNTRQH